MLDTVNLISFPGLGIGEFAVHETAFTLFGRGIAWYALIIMCGVILAILYSAYRTRQAGMSTDDFLDLAIATVLSGFIGARLYYVVMEFEHYLVRGGTFWENLKDTLYNIVAVWNGGLAIYGGVIAGAIAIFITAKIKKINPLQLFDAISPAVMIGQCIGRWGNFVNAEAYGGLTDLPWRMGLRIPGTTNVVCVHPTFLYESLWNLIGFLLIHALYKKKKFHGQIFCMYMIWYGFGRFFIEGLRTDSLYVGSLRISQVVAAVTFLAGIALILTFSRMIKQRTVPYVSLAWRPDSVNPAPKSASADQEADTTATDTENQEK